MSALAGVRDEAEALMRARIDEAIRHFDLAKREDIEAAVEMAAKARAGQEAAEARLADAMDRLAALENRVEALETHAEKAASHTDRMSGNPAAGGGGPGMIA
jgi:BMFP domain-containing protein YqiC